MNKFVVIEKFNVETMPESVLIFDSLVEAQKYMREAWETVYNEAIANRFDAADIDLEASYFEENYARVTWSNEDVDEFWLMKKKT